MTRDNSKPTGQAGHAEAIGPTSGGEAETYQRLRAHLAYLGLTTASETLTEVLDAARQENLTLVAALEWLLAAEASGHRRPPAGEPAA